jgi:protocatechuate 4,5-dioxygenase beta chain
MDNMPAFLIGKAPRAEGPFPHEMRTFGIAPYSAEVEVDVAKNMLQLAPKMGVDFSFSDEFRIDHAFTVRSTSSARKWICRSYLSLPM